jgi:dsDNA-binding SOS-regulon protein
MEITFESSKEADRFIVMAEQADAIEQVAKAQREVSAESQFGVSC